MIHGEQVCVRWETLVCAHFDCLQSSNGTSNQSWLVLKPDRLGAAPQLTQLWPNTAAHDSAPMTVTMTGIGFQALHDDRGRRRRPADRLHLGDGAQTVIKPAALPALGGVT